MNELKQEIVELRAEVKEVKKRLTFTLDATKVEVWIAIDEHPEYMISSFGRVRRKKPRSDGSEFYPKVSLNKNTGYYQVVLNNRTCKLHRLIASAFIPNPEGKPCVDHIDGDKLNNSLTNLRWLTAAEMWQSREERFVEKQRYYLQQEKRRVR